MEQEEFNAFCKRTGITFDMCIKAFAAEGEMEQEEFNAFCKRTGITFAMCIKAFAAKGGRACEILELAEPHAVDGGLELDDDVVISEGDDNGAYVQMWLWVDFADTPLDKEKHLRVLES